MARFRHLASPAPVRWGEWQHGVVLPHTRRQMGRYNEVGLVPDHNQGPDEYHPWVNRPMRPDEEWRPEDTSTKFVGHGERMHALEVTTNDAHEDGLDDDFPDPAGTWASPNPKPFSWSLHRLKGDDPDNPDHWEHLGEINDDHHDNEESAWSISRGGGQWGNWTPNDGNYITMYNTSPWIEQIGGHWGHADSREEAMHHAERAWDAHVERSGWSGEGGDQHHGEPEPDPFGPRTDIDDDYGDIFGGGK